MWKLPVTAGLGAERADDGHIQPSGAERGVGDVNDLVAGWVQGGCRNGMAAAVACRGWCFGRILFPGPRGRGCAGRPRRITFH